MMGEGTRKMFIAWIAGNIFCNHTRVLYTDRMTTNQIIDLSVATATEIVDKSGKNE